MPENAPENFNWRTVHSIVVLGVLGLFLYSIHGILNPFVLFLLLVFVISPYSGTRHHLLIVTASAVLMFVWVLNTTGFLLAPFVLALVLAYIQHPLVSRMEGKRLFGKLRISRTLATAMLTLPALGLVALAVFFAVPAQVVSAAIVGALTWLGFAVAGFPYALLLGVIAGVFNVIPYMGLVASALPAVVIALFSGQ